MFGYIYLIKSSSGEHKIGRTKNVGQRFAQLQANDEHDLQVVRVIESLRVTDNELQLHDKFYQKRTHGEWFNLDEHDLDIFHELADIFQMQTDTAKRCLHPSSLEKAGYRNE